MTKTLIRGACVALLALASGCDGETETPATTPTGETGTGGGTTAPCTVLPDGTWTADGSAFGMAMEMVVTMDSAGCTFTISDWDMVMGTVPEGGTVDGTDVTLSSTEDAYWDSCTGTVSSDGTSVEGICADDGAAFTFEFNG